MSDHFNGSENGNTFDAVYDYQVVSATSTSYLVNITATEGPAVTHYTDFVLKNGTAAWVYFNGANYTGLDAFAIYLASMAPYIIGNMFGEAGLYSQLVNSSQVHETGSSILMLGPTQVNATDYEANSLPVSQATCNGSVYFTRLSLQVGNVTGESLQLLTGLNLAGTITNGGVTESLDISLHITSVTKTS